MLFCLATRFFVSQLAFDVVTRFLMFELAFVWCFSIPFFASDDLDDFEVIFTSIATVNIFKKQAPQKRFKSDTMT